jgi:hypothetical protein
VTDPNLPTAAHVIRETGAGPMFKAKWRYNGQQVWRRIGPAWVERDAAGERKPRRGKVRAGYFDAARAHVAAAELVAQHAKAERERGPRSRRADGATFREVARDYLVWRARAQGANAAIAWLVAEGLLRGDAVQAVLISLGDPRGFDVIDRDGDPVT